MSLADKVIAIRKFYRMSQDKLARKLNTVQSEVHYLERGYIPDDKSMIVIIDELYERIGGEVR